MSTVKVISEKDASGDYPVHTGRSAESVVRRVWGRRAHLEASHDPNNPYGQVLKRASHSSDSWHVLATVLVSR